MWEIARTIPAPVLLIFLGISLCFNRLFIEFAGYRCTEWQRSKWWDALVAMGIGLVASVLTLSVAGLIYPDMASSSILRLVALESIPTSMGAAVAINQLGGGDSGMEATDVTFSADMTVILGTLLGGFLFAFNVAPTIETKVITLQQDWWLIAATFILSVAVAYITVHLAEFSEHDLSKRKYITSMWLETAIAYIIAFLISMLLLWTFGYGTPLDPLEVWLPQTIVLAYATALGGAAGRIVL
jgi:putative integral membrane protein (TIGR02587 family)